MAAPIDKASSVMARSPSDQLAAWMVEYGPALRRYFARRADPASADDLVQEVFLRLQITASQSATDNVERHLFTVAKRVLIDRYRADLRRHADFHDALDETADFPDELSPERILSAKQEYAHVLVAIMNLPPRLRMALVLHRFAKLSFGEIAKRMGIRKTTVRNFVERAIARVALDMEEGQ